MKLSSKRVHCSLLGFGLILLSFGPSYGNDKQIGKSEAKPSPNASVQPAAKEAVKTPAAAVQNADKSKADAAKKKPGKATDKAKSKEDKAKSKDKGKKAVASSSPDAGAKVETDIICPKKLPPVPAFARGDVYKTTPYKQGEKAEYEVKYGGALVGAGILEVKSPYKYQGPYKTSIWHRNFHADAKTGDWYKLIFVAHDKLDALVRPWDSGISRFYMEQDEGQMFGKRLQQKSWIEFHHDKCKVNLRREKNSKIKTEEFDLAYGALDTLGVAFWLREQKFELNKKVRTLVYSSGENWWLEATPVAFEEIETKAGKFKTAKLNLQTYIGQELQQKGTVDVWIATEHPSRPLVQVKAEIKLGSIWIELAKFEPGK